MGREAFLPAAIVVASKLERSNPDSWLSNSTAYRQA